MQPAPVPSQMEETPQLTLWQSPKKGGGGRHRQLLPLAEEQEEMHTQSTCCSAGSGNDDTWYVPPHPHVHPDGCCSQCPAEGAGGPHPSPSWGAQLGLGLSCPRCGLGGVRREGGCWGGSRNRGSPGSEATELRTPQRGGMESTPCLSPSHCHPPEMQR